jgi:hypothetical protein
MEAVPGLENKIIEENKRRGHVSGEEREHVLAAAAAEAAAAIEVMDIP